MPPEQLQELLDNVDLTPDQWVTGTVLIVRTTDMTTGDTALHITSSDATDHITQLGMLTLATDLTRTPCDHDD